MSQQIARVLVWSLVLLPCFAFIAYVGWLFRALGDVFITPVAFDEGTWKTLSKCQPAIHSRPGKLLRWRQESKTGIACRWKRQRLWKFPDQFRL